MSTDALVVGGNGFLGSSVVDVLVDAGRSVRVLDRFSSDHARFASTDVQIVRGRFDDPEVLRPALDGISTLYHFVSASTPASSQSDARADLDANVGGSATLFAAAANAGVERIVFASSGGAVYGDTPSDGAHREDAPLRPLSPYGIGKVAIEHLLRYVARRHGLHSTALRIANPYGPRQPPGRAQGLIPIVIDTVLAGRAVTVQGEGTMIRDYVAVDDLMAMARPLLLEQGRSSVYNLGSGIGHSVLEVIAAVEAAHAAPVQRVRAPQPTEFVQDVVLDIGRYCAEFGPPSIRSLDEGIRDLYRSRAAAARDR